MIHAYARLCGYIPLSIHGSRWTNLTDSRTRELLVTGVGRRWRGVWLASTGKDLQWRWLTGNEPFRR